jgi:hypothetical protein
MEHRLYGAIGRVFGDKVTVVKGFNVEQIATILEEKWDSFADPVSVGLDATKFDMHVCEGMLEWEHSIYRALWRGDKVLERLLKWQMNNEGFGYCDDGKLKYKVKGRRFSGDMNTGLGNCIIMCAAVYAYASERGISIKLMNNGDDCQVLMERKDLKTFMSGLCEWFLQICFRMTVETPVYDISEVEFCQMKLVHTAKGPVMVRNIDTAREKDSISVIPLDTEKSYRKWLWAVGECGLSACSGVPIMQSIYQCYMRHGLPSKMGESVAMSSGMRDFLAKGMPSEWSEISDQARIDVMVAFGYTPEEQMAIEEHYNHLVLDYSVRDVAELNEIFPARL